MKILIIDYGMGNLGSVRRAFEECGATVAVSADPQNIADASGLVLPGVGAFRDGMSRLHETGWADVLRKAHSEKVPLLGICLGMQLLADKSYEGGEFEGLGIISGEVIRLVPQNPLERIPHIGWNEVMKNGDVGLFKNVESATDFYFVHSYHFVPAHKEHILATTPYCGEFVSAVGNEQTFGVQFHPEKSSKPGFQVIRNFLSLL